MKKRFLVCLMAIIMAVSALSVPTFAVEAKTEEDELEQTLKTVFSFLNSQETHLQPSERVDYEIPVGENTVLVTVENQLVKQARTPTYGQDTFGGIRINNSYVYKLTIKNFYSGSGVIMYTIDYHVWRTDDPNTVPFRLTPDKVAIDVTPPSGCTLVSSYASVNPEYLMTSMIETYGDVEFKTAFLGIKKALSLQIQLWSHKYQDPSRDDGYISINYQYEVK